MTCLAALAARRTSSRHMRMLAHAASLPGWLQHAGYIAPLY